MKVSTSVSFSLFLFGATGDLAIRKLFPALFRLYRDQGFNSTTRIRGLARRPMFGDAFAEWLRPQVAAQLGTEWSDETWGGFVGHLDYVLFDPTQPDLNARAIAEGVTIDEQHPGIAYLSTPSSAYADICEALHQSGLLSPHFRLVLEKPIGQDETSAKAIQQAVSRHFSESQIYRIDHYLGKETVQNLFVLRFANPLFEALWNHHYIDHIQITIAEMLGVEGRVEFYESTGALRDMVQNHLLQLLCIVAMEPPGRIEPDRVRDEKLKVLRALRPLSPQSVNDKVVRGQYSQGYAQGLPVPGYTAEPGTHAQSTAETFVAMRVDIDNLRWAGVPFYLRTGKRMPERTCKIVVQFKPIAHSLFTSSTKQLATNRLVITLQPNESIQLRLCGKRHGPGMDVRALELDLSPSERAASLKSDAYHRLLLDVIHGDQTLFVRQDELEAAWAWIDPILTTWAASSSPPEGYTAGSWGPAASTLLLARDGNVWYESTQ